MVLDAFLAQFYKAVIAVLLALLLIALGFSAWKSYALERSEAQREADIAEAIKPYEDAIDQAQKEKAKSLKLKMKMQHVISGKRKTSTMNIKMV